VVQDYFLDNSAVFLLIIDECVVQVHADCYVDDDSGLQVSRPLGDVHGFLVFGRSKVLVRDNLEDLAHLYHLVLEKGLTQSAPFR